MPSVVSAHPYDIFISYRQNDNRTGWVTEFVAALEQELAAAIKEPVRIYFDANPNHGLLETHDVDGSLREKVNCAIFIPVVSQTYCDPKSFAWQKEFLAFLEVARSDSYGLEVKVANGNMTKRVLPVRIHDIDPEDRALFEEATGGVMRSVDFVFKGPGVNRPLNPTDERAVNLNKSFYRDQVNKVANACKEIITAMRGGERMEPVVAATLPVPKPSFRSWWYVAAGLMLIGLAAYLFLGSRQDSSADPFSEQLDQVEQDFEESRKFGDTRYYSRALATCRKILSMEPGHERAMALAARAYCYLGQYDSSRAYVNRVLTRFPNSAHGLLARAELSASYKEHNYESAIKDLLTLHEHDPDDVDIIDYLCGVYLENGEYEKAWEFTELYEEKTGKVLYEPLIELYLVLGDFRLAMDYLEQRDSAKGFTCNTVEEYQRLLLCAGEFDRLTRMTDSVCSTMKCETCPYWQLRARMHQGKFEEASKLVRNSVIHSGGLGKRIAGYVLLQVGKRDSAEIVTDAETQLAKELIADSSYRFSLPFYSLSAIAAMKGNYTESIKHLRRYAELGFVMGSEWYIIRDPLFDGLKSDPRYYPEFIQIVQKAQMYKLGIRERIRTLESQDGG